MEDLTGDVTFLPHHSLLPQSLRQPSTSHTSFVDTGLEDVGPGTSARRSQNRLSIPIYASFNQKELIKLIGEKPMPKNGPELTERAIEAMSLEKIEKEKKERTQVSKNASERSMSSEGQPEKSGTSSSSTSGFLSYTELSKKYGWGFNMLRQMGFKVGGPLNGQKGALTSPLIPTHRGTEGLQDNERELQAVREREYAEQKGPEKSLHEELNCLGPGEDAAVDGTGKCRALAAALRHIFERDGHDVPLHELAHRPQINMLVRRAPVDTLRTFLKNSPSLGYKLSDECDTGTDQFGNFSGNGKTRCTWCSRGFKSPGELEAHVIPLLANSAEADKNHQFGRFLSLLAAMDEGRLPGDPLWMCPLCPFMSSKIECVFAHWRSFSEPCHLLLLRVAVALLLEIDPPSDLSQLRYWVAHHPKSLDDLRMFLALMRKRRPHADATDLSMPALLEVLEQRGIACSKTAGKTELLARLMADMYEDGCAQDEDLDAITKRSRLEKASALSDWQSKRRKVFDVSESEPEVISDGENHTEKGVDCERASKKAGSLQILSDAIIVS